MFNLKRKIYVLKDLPPEVKAVTFAKCSRSPQSFDEIAKELTEEKSAKFHEKWVVGFGHSSVAEHAVLSIAIENVSILATKIIENNRLASYTEKSTRYQVFDKNRYYKPQRIIKSSYGKLYQETGNFLFRIYEDLNSKIIEWIRKKNPKSAKTSEKLYEMVCKSKTCDIVRYILPTATLTNLGMTINARNLEHAICKFLSHPLEEIQEIGKEIKQVALEATPTLVKYAEFNKYLSETEKSLEKLTRDILPKENVVEVPAVTLVDYDKEAEDKLITALLYQFSEYPFDQIKEKVRKLNSSQKEKIIDEALKRLGPHDRPLRELEHIYYTFDILMDYGAFRDIQRHRMCTQTNQDITVVHGYDTPEEIIEIGSEAEFNQAMERAKETFEKIASKFPKEAQYIVPLAYKKRTLFTWNLRELFHFIQLRSSKRGHIAYRRIAQQVYDELTRVHPLLAKYIQVDKS